MTPEQRALFQKMQALMCIIEGYSNHVMNAVGRDLLPNYERIARRFEARQRQRTAAEQLFARLTGLNLKMEQYRLGEIFIDTIAKERGKGDAQRVWDGPEYLPTMDEIRNPSLWLERFDAMTADQLISAGSVASR
jgi:putative hydrolase